MFAVARRNAMNFSTPSRVFLSSIFVVVATLLSAGRLCAHEVWIEPDKTEISAGETLVADLKIGDLFTGDHLIYIPQLTERLFVLTDTGPFDLNPRIGSRPVISVPPEKLAARTGGVVLVYQSANSYVRYASQEKFFRFAKKKGAGDLEPAHIRRQLPQRGFVERYKRFAKASISTGPDSGMANDRAVGMELEFVLLARTLLSDSRHEFNVKLLYQGKSLPGAPVTLFSRDRDGTVETSQLTTDARGAMKVTAEGGLRYLLDHVTIREADPSKDRNRPVWESLWASLTFAGPTP